MCFVNYISTKIVEIPDFTIEFEQEDHLSKLDHKSISEAMPGQSGRAYN